MKHLLLLRHAKSSWSNAGLSDFHRPLNERGEQAAKVIADHLAHKMVLPDAIYCSTAKRTRQTVAALINVYEHPIALKMTRKLYLAPYLGMAEMIQGTDAAVETLMVIAHNPGMEEAAAHFCGGGEQQALDELSYKYPTAACAHLRFDCDSWSEVTKGQGYLEAFIKPRDLME